MTHVSYATVFAGLTERVSICWCCLQVPDFLAADQATTSKRNPVSSSPSQLVSRHTEQSPRILNTISTSAANSAESKRVAPDGEVSKRHWKSLREQVKKPPGQSLLERMQQAAAEQAKIAKANDSVSAYDGVQGAESEASDLQAARESPVRPPRPSGHSKSRLAANRDKLLQAE